PTRPDHRHHAGPHHFARIAVVLCGGWVVTLVSRVIAVEPAAGSLGLFDNHTDVGAAPHPGNLDYDSAKQNYTITACGENMWAKADALHFAWKQLSGDMALEAEVNFIGAGKNPHRKAC